MPRTALASMMIFFVLLLVGCGGGGGSTPPPQPVTVSVSPISASIPAQSSQPFTATVLNTNNTAVTWKVNGTTGGNSTIGTINANGLYQAPHLVPNPGTVTITAVSKADPSKSATASVTITVGISVSPSFAELLLAETQTFSATVTGSSNQNVTWSLRCATPAGAPSCDLNAIGTLTEIAPGIAQYTAPNAIPDNVLTDRSSELAQLQPSASTISVVAAWQQDSSQAAIAPVYVNAGSQSVNQSSQAIPVDLGASGGNSADISNGFCCSGTLGSVVNRNNIFYILSNDHVLARRDQAKPGEAISQPGLVDNNCDAALTVANFTKAVTLRNPNNCTDNCSNAPADAAIAQIVSGKVDTSGTILHLGAVAGGLAAPAPPASSVVKPAPGMAVAKSGRTSGLSCSTILSADTSGIPVGYQTACNGGTNFTVTFDHQIVIESTSFSAPGDSGSLIVNADTAQPVGLLFAGSDTQTIANPISTVLSNLKDSANHVPTMVGGTQHEVAACTGNIGPAPPRGIAAAQMLEDDEVQRAVNAKEAHVQELLSIPAVIGVGVGASDTPGEAAVIVFVEKGKKAGAIPAEVDGVKTRVRETKPFRAFVPTMACPPEKNVLPFPASLGGSPHQLGFPDLTSLRDSESRLQSRQHAPCVKG